MKELNGIAKKNKNIPNSFSEMKHWLCSDTSRGKLALHSFWRSNDIKAKQEL